MIRQMLSMYNASDSGVEYGRRAGRLKGLQRLSVIAMHYL
jgi:hypothetical protein